MAFNIYTETKSHPQGKSQFLYDYRSGSLVIYVTCTCTCNDVKVNTDVAYSTRDARKPY